jgi:uncharacterized Tic20 family protein
VSVVNLVLVIIVAIQAKGGKAYRYAVLFALMQ